MTTIIWFIIFLLVLNLLLLSKPSVFKGGNPWNEKELIIYTKDNPEEFKDSFIDMTLDFLADYGEGGDPEYIEENGMKTETD